jgi:hypothetical protein
MFRNPDIFIKYSLLVLLLAVLKGAGYDVLFYFIIGTITLNSLFHLMKDKS